MDGYITMKLGHKGFQHVTFLKFTYSYNKKELMLLPSARYVKPGMDSVQAVQFPRKGHGCQP